MLICIANQTIFLEIIDYGYGTFFRPGEKPAETWAGLRKQLREYTLNTQRQLEDERAKLLSDNSMLKEQLKENQDYIDHHLIRYFI